MWRGEFLSSDTGRRLVYASRCRRRLHLAIDGTEPRSKSATSREQEVAFQTLVASELRRRKRAAFRGPIVLRLDFRTTERNPGHIHTIAKNFLDLLGRVIDGPRAGQALLYGDDQQVTGLMVRCEHGGARPKIRIEARSLGDFREDLQLATQVSDYFDDDESEDERGAEWHYDFLDGTLDRSAYIEAFGARSYLTSVAIAQQETQRQLLKGDRLSIHDLAYFFRAVDPHFKHESAFLDSLASRWENHFTTSPFRILLGELPKAPGSSNAYREQVLAALRTFRDDFRRSLSPLRIPVALEVVVKPSPLTRQSAIHDLDNVLRRFLIPGIVETFQPPSHYLWALESVYGEESERSRSSGAPLRTRLPPKSTAVGLVRMEAWRIPRAAGDVSPGFVSVALVPDEFGHSDTLSVIDGAIERWLDAL